MPDEKSAGAVIFRLENKKRKYLVLMYQAGHWDLVKGHIEEGEKLKETVIRETQEETGISDLKFIPGFEEKISYTFTKDHELVSKEVNFFLSETKTEKIILSHEHLDFVWLNYEEAFKKVTFEQAKSLIEKAEKFLKKKPNNFKKQ